jgi:hypothetical protein
MIATWRLSGALLLAGCGGANAGQSGPEGCPPVESPATDLTGRDLGGDYTVKLVATAGGKRGSMAEGKLALQAQDSSYRMLDNGDGMGDTTFTLPWYGSTAIDLESVGAIAPGDPESTDPASPGVLVIERPGRVLLRMGSEANRRGMRRFDGAFTVMEVRQVTDSGFAGTWRSGVGLEESGGHFCAVRAS